MAKSKGRVLLWVMLVVLVASGWRQVALEGEKHRLAQAYQHALQELDSLDVAHRTLSGDLAQARHLPEFSGEEIKALREELRRIKDQLVGTLDELAAAREAYAQLEVDNTSLNAQLEVVEGEKQKLLVRYSSIDQLRRAISEVKQSMRMERSAARRARIQALKEADRRQLALGNRGYVVRDRVSTLGVLTQLHVHVRELESP